MKISLKKPFIILDLEATGLDVAKDRIIEIGMLKRFPDGKEERFLERINPEMPITPEAAEITGITDEMVKDAPTFQSLVSKIAAFIDDADLGGYNSNKFDIPMLAEEFLRTDSDFDIRKRVFVDVQNIFHKMEQRTLSAAYQFYCEKQMENAHNAAYDAEVTFEVFKAQLEKYSGIGESIEELAIFTRYGNNELADFAGRLALIKGKVAYNFGKHKGKTVEEVDRIEPGYYGWMQDADFPRFTKQVLKDEMEIIKNNKKNFNEEQQINSPVNKQVKEPAKEATLDQLSALQAKFKK